MNKTRTQSSDVPSLGADQCLFSPIAKRGLAGLFVCAVFVMAVFGFLAWSSIQPNQSAFADDGTFVIAIDPGHGGDEEGAYQNGLSEKETNWKIANHVVNELNTYYGVRAVLTRSYYETMDREQRILSAERQGASVLVSIHCDSSESQSAHGATAIIPNESAYLYNETHLMGERLGNCILAELGSLGVYSRGTYMRDCTTGEQYPYPGGICDWYGINYWARWHAFCGIIIEHGFLSNPEEAARFASDSWCAQLGVADATGIAKCYGLVKKSQVAEPEDKLGEAVSTTVEMTQGSSEADPSIMGTPKTTVQAMVDRYAESGHSYPSNTYTKYGAATINDFCRILYDEAVAEGVRPEIVFAQAMHETGWLGFGGDVSAEQCNFGGLGATGGGVPGEDFSSYGANGVRIGLRAQVQHLKGYASKDDLNQACVDNRFKYLAEKRGIAPTVSGLQGNWATSTTYAAALTNLVNSVLVQVPSSYVSRVRFNIENTPNSDTVYLDGVPQTITRNGNYATVDVTGSESHVITMFDYNTSSDNPHLVYPTGMSVWLVTFSNGSFVAQRHYMLDEALQYAGSSIRVSGNRGIRLITGMDQQTKTVVSVGNIGGYTLKETGTLIAWSKNVENNDLTLNTQGVSRGRAYIANTQDPVFEQKDGVSYYTNVLVGFSVDQCKEDLSMRPYLILENSAGDEMVLYGGCVQRSIQYIATQNANAFAVGSDAYNFVHSLINA